MPDFPVALVLPGVQTGNVVSSLTPHASTGIMKFGFSTPNSLAHSFNTTYYIPIRINFSCVVDKFFVFNGSVVTGNIELGLYDKKGVKIIGTAATAQSGTEVIQTIDVTDTPIAPGSYYLAFACTGQARTHAFTAVNFWTAKMSGTLRQTSGTLPATATFAVLTASFRDVPIIGFYYKTPSYTGTPMPMLPTILAYASVESQAFGHMTYPGNMVDFAWSSANTAIYVPIQITETIALTMFWVINGTVVSGNIDVGLYDWSGRRITSIGSTAQSGITDVQKFDVTDILVPPGRYYIAYVMDNTTGKLYVGGSTGPIVTLLGFKTQTSAFPLPATATFDAVSSQVFAPMAGMLNGHTVI